MSWDYRIYEVYNGWLVETANGGTIFVTLGNNEKVNERHLKFIKWLESIGKLLDNYVGDKKYKLKGDCHARD